MQVMHTVGLIVLIAVFALGTFTSLNLGVLGFVAAFAMGTIFLGQGSDAILAGFPADLFILIFGVTFLFAIVGQNGTLEWLIQGMTRRLRGNAAAAPVVVFVIVSAIASAGPVAPSVCAIVGPMALGMARQLGINRILMSIMVTQGATAGTLTPLGGLGTIVNGIVQRNGIVLAPVTLFVTNYVFNLALALAAYVIFRGWKRIPPRAVSEECSSGTAGIHPPVRTDSGAGMDGAQRSAAVVDSPSPMAPATPDLDAPRVATLCALVVLAISVLGFGLNVGFVALILAVLLQLVFPKASEGALAKSSWAVIVLICGIVTFIALLESAGTLDVVGQAVASLRPAIFAVFVLCLMGAFTSALASSAATIAVVTALALPLTVESDLIPAAVIAGVAMCAIAVDASPFSSTGAVVVASASPDERDKVYRGLLGWGMSMVVAAPVIASAGVLLAS
ncbi:SLC13 family permease [Pseudonocardia sp. NPDC049635]|uniref:SLC13 family permease n=1 Tax=Pseudonocardia sp. NPDC049635 TaxID=3155506 RepID=UPI0033F336B3